jgi:hypothetical protein
VLEINRTCAVQTGCFVGDTAGSPVTISAADGATIVQGNNSSANNGDGIVARAECLVKDNVVFDNKGFGLNVSSPLVTSVGYTNNASRTAMWMR